MMLGGSLGNRGFCCSCSCDWRWDASTPEVVKPGKCCTSHSAQRGCATTSSKGYLLIYPRFYRIALKLHQESENLISTVLHQASEETTLKPSASPSLRTILGSEIGRLLVATVDFCVTRLGAATEAFRTTSRLQALQVSHSSRLLSTFQRLVSFAGRHASLFSGS